MNQLASINIKNILTSSPALVIYAGTLCFMLALLCIAFSNHSQYISIWLPNAVLLVFIFRSPAALSWPLFCAGLLSNIIANYIVGAPLMVAIAISAANSIEILLPMLCVSRDQHDHFILKTLNTQTILLALTVAASCLAAAAFASLLISNDSQIKSTSIIFNWFTVDLLAMMAILPLGLSATTERAKKLIRSNKFIELVIVAVLAATFTWISMYYSQMRFIIISMPLLYAAYRLGLLGTSIIFFITVTVYISHLIIFGISDTPYVTMPALISYSSLMMCITLIPALVIAILIDQRDDYEHRLKESEERFHNAIKYSAIGMALMSPHGRWLEVNPALCQLTGYTEVELKKLALDRLIYSDDIAIDHELMKKVEQHLLPSYSIEKRCVKKNGGLIWILLTVSAVYDRHQKPMHYVMQFENINDRKHVEVELKHQASHDSLTGLINRREMENKIQILIGDTRKTNHINSLFFIDLDNFKTINDTAGHAAGDVLLKKISALFSQSLRDTDTVARMGGDEFAVILPDCSIEDATTIANNMIKNISSYQFTWDNKIYRIGVSVGIVSFKPHQATLATLLSHADSACYMAKKQGGNRYIIADS